MTTRSAISRFSKLPVISFVSRFSISDHKPGKSDFFADTRGCITANLSRHSLIWQKVLPKVLDNVVSMDSGEKKRWGALLLNATYRLIPVNGNASTIDVCRVSVLKVLQARVTRLLKYVSKVLQTVGLMADLSIAGLEAEMEETANAVLSGGWRVEKNKSKPANA